MTALHRALGLSSVAVPLANVPLSPALLTNAVFALIAATVPLFIADTVVALSTPGSSDGGKTAGKAPSGVVRLAGLFVGCLYAFSSLTWTYSNGSEVFSLNNAFVAVICWLVASYDRDTRRPRGDTTAVPVPTRRLAVLCFVSGLGLTNQHTLVFLVVPLALWVLVIGSMRHGWTVSAVVRLLGWYVGTGVLAARQESLSRALLHR